MSESTASPATTAKWRADLRNPEGTRISLPIPQSLRDGIDRTGAYWSSEARARTAIHKLIRQAQSREIIASCVFTCAGEEDVAL